MDCSTHVEYILGNQLLGGELEFVEYLCSIALPAQEIASELQHWRNFQNTLSALGSQAPSIEEIRTVRRLLHQGQSPQQAAQAIHDERKVQQEKASILKKIQNIRPSSPSHDDSPQP